MMQKNLSAYNVGSEGTYCVSFRVNLTSLVSTRFNGVYLRNDYMANSYVFSKGSTN